MTNSPQWQIEFPGYPVNKVVQLYYFQEYSNCYESPVGEKFLPATMSGFAISYRPSTEVFGYTKELSGQKIHPHFIISPQTQAYEIHHQGDNGMVCVVLYPGMLYRLFNIPVEMTVDNGLALEDCMGAEIKPLIDEVQNAADNRERVRIIEKYLHRKMQESDIRVPAFDYAISLIHENKAILKVGDIARHIELSERSVEQMFKTQIGLTPKKYLRISRLREAAKIMRTDKQLTLTQIGLILGYCDQPHFVRDFVQLTGIKPREFLQSTYEEVLNENWLGGFTGQNT